MPLIGYAITGSLSLAGAIGGVGMVCSLLMVLPGGIAADRVDRKKLLTTGHALGVLIWAGAIVAYVSGILNTPGLFILAALSGIRGGFFRGASVPALRQLVPSEQLPRALAANQARDGVIEMISGPLGGFLVALSVSAPFAAEAIGHAVAWLFSRTIRADLRPGRQQSQTSGSRETINEAATSPRVSAQLRAGFTWLVKHRTITTLTILIAIIAASTSGLLQTLILSLAANGENETRIGLISTSLAAGMIFGAFVAGRLTSRLPTGKLAISSLVFSAVTLTPLLLSDNFYAVLAFVAISSLGIPVFNSSASGWSIAQLPEDQVGSIVAAVTLINAGLLPLAPLLAGFGLDTVGYAATLTIFIVLNLSAALGTALLPEFRKLGKPSEWTTSISEDETNN